jgi:hypothetical protein
MREEIMSCRRKQDGHAREVHEVATASGPRLVIRGEAENGIALVFSELRQVTCG